MLRQLSDSSAAHDVQFSLAQAAIGAGAPIRAVIRELQDAWGDPHLSLVKAKKRNKKTGADDDDDSEDDDAGRALPGGHPIPELARSERAFYEALTRDQRAAYDAVAELVDTLYREGKGWAGVDPFAFDEPIEQWKRRAFLALATHPMQAYSLGQMLTQEALGSVIARPFYPTDREAIKFLEHTTFNEVGAAFDRFKQDLKATLIQGMKDGENPLEMARQLQNTFKDYESDFGILAVTENTRAESAGRLNELKDGNVEYALGSSAHDAKACEFCRTKIDGQKVRVSDVIGQSNYGRKKADWLQVIPAHPWCRCLWLPWSPGTQAIIRGEPIPSSN